MTRKGRSDFAAGVVALVVVAIGCWFAFVGELPWRHGYEIHAVFSSSNELKPGVPVRIAGVTVGKVVEIGRGPGHTADVALEIDDDGRPVHADATAKVRPRTLLEGNFYVELEPGTPGSPELRDGGTLPLTQTAVPVQLDQILQTFDSSTRAQTRALVHEYGLALADGGARGLRQSYPSWPGAFAGIAVTSQALRGTQPGDLPAAIAASGRVAATLSAREARLAGLVTNYARTTTALTQREGALAASVRAAAALAATARPRLAEIDALLPALARFGATLRPALRALPGTVALALPALQQLDGLLQRDEAPALAASARPALRALTVAEPRLGGLFDRVAPVSSCVRDKILPVLKTPVDDGPLSTGLPPWQELLQNGVGLSSSSQNFDGNGPQARFLAGAGEQLFSTGERLPNVDQVYGTQPVVGARPAFPGTAKLPPFRPDAPCGFQPTQSLAAETTQAVQQGVVPQGQLPADVLGRIERLLQAQAAKDDR